MTEAEWLSCQDPGRMLASLRGKASPRKLRLFACACCRLIWDLLRNPAERHAVEVGERVADGLADEEEMRRASESAWHLLHGWPQPLPLAEVRMLTAWAAVKTVSRWHDRGALLREDLPAPARHAVAAELWCAAGGPPDPVPRWPEWAALLARVDDDQGRLQSELLRCLFGSPARPVRFSPEWREWDGGVPLRLASEVYESRDFTKAPLLADALEDAGCAEASVLGHLRGSGPHVRGCWAVDLVLGKGVSP